MPLGDGIYIITNVKQRNLVFLENPDDCTPLQGHYRKNQPGEQWRVIDCGNGQHSIRNVDYKRYANCGSLAGLGAFVEGHGREQLWHVQERSKGNYTIAATDTGNFWMLPYNEPGTPVGLLDKPTDQRCWWTFTNPAAEAPVNKDPTEEYLLFELKPLPILPFSPLKLDFLIIQDVSQDSISNASRTICEMCGPLVSSRRSQPGAFCANIIEFRASSSNKVFYHQFSDFMTFETLRNIEGANVSWKRCNGSSLPEIVVRGLRADAAKVAILNLSATLLQQGGKSIIVLINRLFEQDLRLILTPIRPSWEDAFYKGPVFKKLDEISREFRLFEKIGEFSDYVVDYNDTIALPRLAEDAGLRDELRPNIAQIIKVLKDENPEAQLAAVGALSQLAKHADLHENLCKAILEIVGMLRLKGNNCGVKAAASALIKLAESVDLHHIFCQAVPHMTEMLKDENHDIRSAAVAVLSKLAEHTQLHDAIFHAVLTVTKTLVRDSAKGHHFQHGGMALSWAAGNGYDEVVRLLLLQKDVKVDDKDYDGRTPLSWAAGNGHDAVVRILLAQEGVNVDSRDKNDQTPLSWAAEEGHDAVVRLLLTQEGVDVNSKDLTGRTPLSWAAGNDRDAIVCLLLAQEGVDADSKDKRNQTPLSWAAEEGHGVVVRLLLSQEGVDANSKDASGRTPLLWATRNGKDGVICLLLGQEGVDANYKDDLGLTLLSLAANNGHDGPVRLLLEHGGVDVNSKDNLGRTPLSFAAEKCYDAIVRLLLAHGAVDTRRRKWWRK